MSKTKIISILLFIIALGAFLRIYNIDSAPPGIYPDEAVNGIDAARALETGQFRWFYPDNQGREGLFMNLVALCFKLFGISILTLKLPSIIFGTLTILGVYLLGKELFRNERIGLIAAFLTSVSFWAINFSRISFRANMLPTILVFSFYFLFKGLRTQKWTAFAAGGFIFGLGLHTYISFRIAPAILFTLLVALIINRRRFLKNYLVSIAVFSLFAFLSSSPMLYTFFVSHPEYLESRSSSISVFSPEANGGSPAKAFLKSFSLSLIKYNFWGDQNWRHNFPPYPLLDPLAGIAFAFGLIYSVIKLLRLASLRLFKKVRDFKLATYLLLIVSFFLMLAPEFLTAEGNPHALRAIGTLPFVFIFAAMTLNYFIEYAERYGKMFQKIVFSLFILMIIAIGAFNISKYFVFWAKKPQTAQAFEKNLMDTSRYIQTLPWHQEKFIITQSMQRIPIKLFNYGRSDIQYFYPGEIENLSPKDKNNFIIILTGRDDHVIGRLQEKFPGLELEEKKDALGQNFFVLK